MAKCKGCFYFLFACTCVTGPWALVFSHQPASSSGLSHFILEVHVLYSEEQNKIILLSAIVLILKNSFFVQMVTWQECMGDPTCNSTKIPECVHPLNDSPSLSLPWGKLSVSSHRIWDMKKERNQKAFTVSSGWRKRWLPKMLEEKNKEEKKDLKNYMGTSKDTCWLYSA